MKSEPGEDVLCSVVLREELQPQGDPDPQASPHISWGAAQPSQLLLPGKGVSEASVGGFQLVAAAPEVHMYSQAPPTVTTSIHSYQNLFHRFQIKFKGQAVCKVFKEAHLTVSFIFSALSGRRP